MEDYFKRQIQLWGEDKQTILKSKKIAIIGCGGLGNSIAIALGSSGIGEIHLIDFDIVSTHNIHRQISFKLNDENRFKADVLKEFLDSRINNIKICPHNIGFEKFVDNNSIKFDLIIDATDNLESRIKIDKFAKSSNTPWIYGSVEEFNGQACLFKNSKFNDIFKIEKAIPKGISAPMVMNIASIQALMAIRYLIGMSVKSDILKYVYLEDGDLVIKNFKLPK